MNAKNKILKNVEKWQGKNKNVVFYELSQNIIISYFDWNNELRYLIYTLNGKKVFNTAFVDFNRCLIAIALNADNSCIIDFIIKNRKEK